MHYHFRTIKKSKHSADSTETSKFEITENRTNEWSIKTDRAPVFRIVERRNGYQTISSTKYHHFFHQRTKVFIAEAVALQHRIWRILLALGARNRGQGCMDSMDYITRNISELVEPGRGI